MSKLLYIIVFILAGFLNGFAQNNITGALNNYALVQGQVSATVFQVDSTFGFFPGDTVLLIQMNGALVDKSNTSAAGSVSDFQNTGVCEFLILSSVDNTNKRLGVVCPPVKSYDFAQPGVSVQFVTVPNFSNATVPGNLTCKSWDKSIGKGGVLAFIVQNTLTLNGDIDVSAKGFRGGMPLLNLPHCAEDGVIWQKYGYNSPDSAGMKGEGIARQEMDNNFGRGCKANGGGGGNMMNAGGGGGANYGDGGKGGKESEECTSALDVGGLGGVDLTSSFAEFRVFMGGGGGCGTNESVIGDATPGGHGGGIVFIIAGSIEGNSHFIKANGESVTGSTSTESAGGGGGGGSVVVFAGTINGNLFIQAQGGNGGSTAGINDRGPGGGGGGGVIYHNSVFTGSVTTSTIKGSAGICAPCGNTYNAADGNGGSVVNGLSLPFTYNSCSSIVNNVIQSDQSICYNTLAQLTGTLPTGGTGVYNYQWQRSIDGSSWLNAPGVSTGQNYNTGLLIESFLYRRVINIGSAEESVSNVVQVFVLPDILNNHISSNQLVCPGVAPILINGTVPSGGNGTYFYAWENSADGIAFSPITGATNAVYQPLPLTQNTWFRRVVTSGVCISVSDTVFIEIAPEITNNIIDQNQILCTGMLPWPQFGTLPQGGNGTYAYLWESSTDFVAWNPATPNPVNNEQNYNTPAITQNTWFRRIVFSAGCADTSNIDTVKVLSGSVPIVNIIDTSTQNLCKGIIPAPISGSPATGGNGSAINYVWFKCEQITFDPLAVATEGTYEDPDLVFDEPADTSFYYNRFAFLILPTSELACITPSQSVRVNVSSVINTIAPTDTLVCSGSSPGLITGNSDNTYSYSWQYYNGSGWQNLSSFSENLDPGILNQTTQFRRIVSDGICTDTSMVVTIHVLPQVTGNSIKLPSGLTSQAFCGFATIQIIPDGTLTGGDGTFSYLWISSIDTATWLPALGDNDSLLYMAGTVPSTRQYRRIVNSGGCADTSNVVTLEIVPEITGNQIYAENLSTTGIVLCAHDTVYVGSPASFIGGGNGTYQYEWWTSWNGSVWNPAIFGFTEYYMFLNLTSDRWFRRVVTSGVVCTDTSNVIFAHPVPEPENSIVGGGVYCAGSPADSLRDLNSPLPVPSFTYRWESKPAAGGVWTTIAGATETGYYPGILAYSTLFRRVMTFDSCVVFSNEITIDITSGSDVSLHIVPGTEDVCLSAGSGASIKIHTSGTGPWTITVSNGSQNFVYNQSDTVAQYTIPMVIGANTYQVTAVTDGGNCAPVSLGSPVTVTGWQEVTSNPGNGGDVCANYMQLNASPPTIGTITWQADPSLSFIPGVNVNNPMVTASVWGTFDVMLVAQNGACSDTGTIQLGFYHAPDPAEPGPMQILGGATTAVMAATPPAYGIGTWTVVSGNGVFSNVNDPAAVVTGLNIGDNVFEWTVTNGTCAPSSAKVTIRTINLEIPEGFSPNGDGLNDYYVIPGITNYNDNALHIYNRWGLEVYYKKNYDNNWNGRDMSGNLLPDDTYFYVLVLDNGESVKGFLVLKR